MTTVGCRGTESDGRVVGVGVGLGWGWGGVTVGLGWKRAKEGHGPGGADASFFRSRMNPRWSASTAGRVRFQPCVSFFRRCILRLKGKSPVIVPCRRVNEPCTLYGKRSCNFYYEKHYPVRTDETNSNIQISIGLDY